MKQMLSWFPEKPVIEGYNDTYIFRFSTVLDFEAQIQFHC